MHATCVFTLLLDLYGLNSTTFVFIVNLVNLILEEFIIIALFVVHDATDCQQKLNNDALH